MTDQKDSTAKRPLTVLAGPYGHPFHSIIVTVVIGAWLASAVFDIIGLGAEDAAPYAVGSRLLITIGLAASVPAIVFGILDYVRIPDHTQASRTASVHMAINFVVCGAYAVQLLFRFTTQGIPIGMFVLSCASLALLSVSGWLGGKLSYRYGVRVAADADQAHAFQSKRVS